MKTDSQATRRPVRNYGVDALRLVAMFLVAVLHVLGYGGVLEAAKGGAERVSWLLEACAFCAVDCYALISGFVGYTPEKKEPRFSKYVSLWLRVVFYSFGITLLACILKPGLVAPGDLLRALFPVSTSHYWYFTAYTGLFFLIPWLNALVRGLEKRALTGLVLTCGILFSLYASIGTAVEADVFYLEKGYSCAWLVLLYLTGAWMKKCGIPKKMNLRIAAMIAATCVLAGWAARLWIPQYPELLLSYTSPTVVFPAVFLLAWFSRLCLRGWVRRVVCSLAPAAFGVYLLHTQKIVWENCIGYRFTWIAEAPVWLLPLEALGCAAGIFIVCLLIEKLRLLLFRALRIDRCADIVYAWIEAPLRKRLQN